MELRDVLQLIGTLTAFLMALGAFSAFVMRQLDNRFAAQDQARAEGAKALHERIEGYTAQARATADQVGRLERDFLEWKAEMPLQYVRREDYVVGQSVIQARLDALYNKLEVVQLHVKGGNHD